MFIVAAVLIAILTVPLVKGRFHHLDAIEVRGAALLLTALAIQIVIISVIPHRLPGIHAPAHIVSYLMAGTFFWLNRRIAGLWIIGVGGGLNFTAIAANSGVMPAAETAVAASNAPTAAAGTFINSAPLAAPRLAFLGDVFSLPPSWPLSNVFSIGDVVIVVGAFIAVHVLSQSKLFSRFRRDFGMSPVLLHTDTAGTVTAAAE